MRALLDVVIPSIYVTTRSLYVALHFFFSRGGATQRSEVETQIERDRVPADRQPFA